MRILGKKEKMRTFAGNINRHNQILKLYTILHQHMEVIASM
jgi:hypothetical protein